MMNAIRSDRLFHVKNATHAISVYRWTRALHAVILSSVKSVHLSIYISPAGYANLASRAETASDAAGVPVKATSLAAALLHGALGLRPDGSTAAESAPAPLADKPPAEPTPCCAMAKRLEERLVNLDDELRKPAHPAYAKLAAQYGQPPSSIERHKKVCLGLAAPKPAKQKRKKPG